MDRHLITRLLPVDFGIGSGAAVGWFLMVPVDDVGTLVVVALVLYLVHTIAWMLYLRQSVEPLRAWTQSSDHAALSDEELVAIDRSTGRLPVSFATAYTASWFIYFGGLALAPWVVEGLANWGTPELITSVFLVLAAMLCAPALVIAFVRYLLEDPQIEIAAALERRGLSQVRESAPMNLSLTVIILCMVFGPVLWYMGLTYQAQVQGAREVAAVELRESVRRAAEHLRAGQELSEEGHELVDSAQLPPSLAGAPAELEALPLVVIDARKAEVRAAAFVADERWVVARAPIEVDTTTFWIGLATYAVSIISYALLAITGTTRAIFHPLARLRDVVREVAEHGDLSAAGRAPMVRRDEIGELTLEVNRTFHLLEDLANAASTIAAGDLEADIAGSGQLQDAFRSMLDRLRQLVEQSRESSLGLASAAAEILAATEAQASVSSDQSREANDVSRYVATLVESAVGISDAAATVLENAELSRSHGEQVAQRLSELSAHVAGVSELLELIREIADRSDLLALNGSLEATRAGEAGRGFALVATEMRRLAERVTKAVEDLRTLAADIESSRSSTLSATEASRETIEQTASAARRIVELTGQQRVETERVSGNARQIAEAVTESVATTQQTRATADGLREQARALEALIAEFQ